MSDPDRLTSLVTMSPLLAPVLRRWSTIALPDSWLVAGAIAQTVWNDASGFPLQHGISDIDIVYFDAADLSQETEARHAARLQAEFDDLPVRLDVKNEARVHLWYETKFGYPIRPYSSSPQAIATFPTTATSIGIRPEASGLALCAPYGLSDLFGLIVRPNKTQITRAVYQAKIARWTRLWPKLNVIAWDDRDSGAPIRIAAAIIFNEAGEILLVRKRGFSVFMQPGGKIEPGETPLAALKRELREEIGLVIDDGALRYLGSFSAAAANENDRRVDAETFEISLREPVAAAAEIEEIIWVDPFGRLDIPLATLSRDHMVLLAQNRRRR